VQPFKYSLLYLWLRFSLFSFHAMNYC